jgi:hypothetical protein
MSGVMKTCVIKFIRKGTGISRTETEYAQNQSSTTAPTSGWNVNPPTWQNGYYIWQRIKFIYTDNSYSYSNPVCISGGRGISTVTEHYLATSASSGVTKNTSGWTTTVQAVTSTKRYLWNYETTTFTDGSTVDTTPIVIGVYGQKGDIGVSISSITEYYLATSSSSGVTRSTPGWTESVQQITATKKYLWNYEKVTFTDNSVSYTEPAIIGVYGDKGDPGTGISSITEYYLATSSSSGVSRSTSGWTTSVQSVTATKKYLWNYEKITYADNTTSYTDPIIIGVYGDKGVGISSVTEYYLATSSSSGVSRNTSGWTTSVQSVTSTKKYLWNYEKITYTDNTTSYTDPVIIGVYGDKGDPGSQGKQGPTLRVQDWNKCTSNGTANYTFYQGDVENLDEPYKDVVLYEGYYYSCIKTHSNKSIKPTNQTFWQLGDPVEIIATNVLLATYSLIKNLGAEAIEMKDGNGNILFSAKNGVVTCNTGNFKNVTISGVLNAVTGTFKTLDCVDANGNVVGRICASTSAYGGVGFETVDIIQNGQVNSRTARFYAADIWCRGGFGARMRNTLVVKGTYAWFYPKGISGSAQQVNLTSGTSSGGETYYNLPCYGESNDASGFPVDLIVFNISSSTVYRYNLQMAETQRVLLVNGNDDQSNVQIYSNGNKVWFNGGEMAEVVKLPISHMNPTPGSTLLGRGIIAGAVRDNDWS